MYGQWVAKPSHPKAACVHEVEIALHLYCGRYGRERLLAKIRLRKYCHNGVADELVDEAIFMKYIYKSQDQVVLHAYGEW